MEKQYLNPETYIKIIDDLGRTISGLNIEVALLRAQNEEVSSYAMEIQEKLERLEKPTEMISSGGMPLAEQEEIVNE